MDKTTHTPGPWRIDEAVLWRIRCNPTPQVDTGTTVCEMCSDRTIAETAANARLIAAAPDLLAALEAILPYLPYMPPADCRVTEQLKRDPEYQAVTAARAAIRAARGEG